MDQAGSLLIISPISLFSFAFDPFAVFSKLGLPHMPFNFDTCLPLPFFKFDDWTWILNSGFLFRQCAFDGYLGIGLVCVSLIGFLQSSKQKNCRGRNLNVCYFAFLFAFTIYILNLFPLFPLSTGITSTSTS